MAEQWLEKTVTKSLLSALGKPAQAAGLVVGDVLQFREKVTVTPVPPPPPDPPAEHHTPPPVTPPPVVEPPPAPTGAVELFTCRMGARMSPFVPMPFPAWPVPPGSNTFEYAAYDQPQKWTALLYGCDVDRTKLEIVNGQLVTTIADGPTASKNNGWTGNNYAALCLLPKLGEGVPLDDWLHWTFRVDPHLTGRRWLEVLAYEAGTPLLNPNATRNFPQTHITGQGQVLCWLIDATGHQLDVTVPGEPYGDYFRTKVLESQCVSPAELFAQPPVPLAARRHWDRRQWGNDLNGTQELLGPEHLRRFDLYFSRTHWAIYEGGQLIKQGAFAVPLRWGRVQIALTHMLYHSSLEAQELAAHNPEETRFLSDLRGHDVRFWDDFVLTREAGLPG